MVEIGKSTRRQTWCSYVFCCRARSRNLVPIFEKGSKFPSAITSLHLCREKQIEFLQFFSTLRRSSNLPTIKHQEGTHLCACISVYWALNWNHWNSNSERELINWKLDTRHLFNVCSTSVFGHGSVVYSPNRSTPVASTKPYSRLELSKYPLNKAGKLMHAEMNILPCTAYDLHFFLLSCLFDDQ